MPRSSSGLGHCPPQGGNACSNHARGANFDHIVHLATFDGMYIYYFANALYSCSDCEQLIAPNIGRDL